MRILRKLIMHTDFKKKRIDYLNSWPNVEPFEIEKRYYERVRSVKSSFGTVAVPFKLKENGDAIYNRAVSFMIEAFDQIERYPNFSYELIFTSYDSFIEHFYPTQKITYKCKKLCDNEWKSIIIGSAKLTKAFEKLFSVIPIKACQYMYTRLTDRAGDPSYKRLTTAESGQDTADSVKRRDLVDDIEAKYGNDSSRYGETIRNASMLYRLILRNDEILISSKKYSISLEDKLHILVSGFLYTFRNDMTHGSSISITKSSKTTLSTYAVDYYAFLLMYYLVILLIIDKFPSDYPSSVCDDLADNIEVNIDLYKRLFGKAIER